jgi:hypothetical protein
MALAEAAKTVAAAKTILKYEDMEETPLKTVAQFPSVAHRQRLAQSGM